VGGKGGGPQNGFRFVTFIQKRTKWIDTKFARCDSSGWRRCLSKCSTDVVKHFDCDGTKQETANRSSPMGCKHDEIGTLVLNQLTNHGTGFA
jgi:hypothetical protein